MTQVRHQGASAVKKVSQVNARREADWADSGQVRKDGTALNACYGCKKPIRTFVNLCSDCQARCREFWQGLYADLGDCGE